jgi:hypothetical protein
MPAHARRIAVALTGASLLAGAAATAEAATVTRGAGSIRYAGRTGVVASFRPGLGPAIEFATQRSPLAATPEPIVGCPPRVPEQTEIINVSCRLSGVSRVTLLVGRAGGAGVVGSIDALPVRARVYGGPHGDNLLVTDRPRSERGPIWTARRLVPALYGGGGSDQLRLWAPYTGRPSGGGFASGGPGNDRIAGSQIPDLLLGGTGNDTINVRGGARDVVDCGPGRDSVFLDPGDVARRCELFNKLFPSTGIDITIRPGEVP